MLRKVFLLQGLDHLGSVFVPPGVMMTSLISHGAELGEPFIIIGGEKIPIKSIPRNLRHLMPFMSDKQLYFEDKFTDSKNSESRTIYRTIYLPNRQTAEAIFVEDKEKASVQNVEIVEEAEKKH